MRYYFTLFLLSALSISSCKKNEKTLEPVSVEVDTLINNGFKFNYASINIEGKNYICQDNGGSLEWGNQEVNRKTEFVSMDGIKIGKGDPDSVLFYRKYRLSNDSTIIIDVLFCKKLAKKDCRNEMSFFYPKNSLDLFKTGLQGFATDFERENSYDGIGINVILKNGDKYVTHSTYSLQYPSRRTSITNDSQKGSYFDITKVSYIPLGDYIEAKFKAKTFNLEGDVKTIEKGFLRLNIGHFTPQ